MKFSIILLSLLIASSLSINANRLKKKTTSNDAYTIKITPPNGKEETFKVLTLDEDVSKYPKGLIFTAPKNAKINQSFLDFLELRAEGNSNDKGAVNTYMLPTVYINSISAAIDTGLFEEEFVELNLAKLDGEPTTLVKIFLPHRTFSFARNRRNAIISGINVNKEKCKETIRAVMQDLEKPMTTYFSLVNSNNRKKLNKQEKEAEKASLQSEMTTKEASLKEVQKEIETLKEEIRKKENELALKRETNNKIAGELKVISDSIANLDKDQEKIEEEIKQNQEAKKTAVEIMQTQLTNLTLFEPKESTVKLNSYITGKEVEKAYDFLTKRLN